MSTIACHKATGEILMRRRQFIAGLGSAAVWPVAARAQQAVVPVVGFVSAATADTGTEGVAAFRAGLFVKKPKECKKWLRL
jgi:hypothetical protein